jgi:hypothetical protein
MLIQVRSFILGGVITALITLGIASLVEGDARSDPSTTPPDNQDLVAQIAAAVSQVSSTRTAPQPVQAPPAQPVTVPVFPSHRIECAAIRGTDYQSIAEGEWYNRNCAGSPLAVTATLNTAALQKVDSCQEAQGRIDAENAKFQQRLRFAEHEAKMRAQQSATSTGNPAFTAKDETLLERSSRAIEKALAASSRTC